MDTLHTADDDRPTITLLVESRHDLDVAGLMEDDDPRSAADLPDAELDARAARNQARVDAYEAAWLANLTAIARERDITVQVAWNHCPAVDFPGDESLELLTQTVYQQACDRTPVPTIESVTA